MSRKVEHYHQAAQRSRLARRRFLDDLAYTRTRLESDRLKRYIGKAAKRQVEYVKLKAEDAVRRHPWAVTAITAGLSAWLFRRPLAALSRLLVAAISETWRSTSGAE